MPSAGTLPSQPKFSILNCEPRTAVMANVCTKLAQHYEKCRNDEKAMQYYNEALRADDAHEPSILLLAKMHLRRGELEACQQQCVTLMRISKDEVSEEPSGCSTVRSAEVIM